MAAISLAVETQRPCDGNRGPNTYVTSRSGATAQMGADRPTLGADVARRPDELGVGVAHLILAQPPPTELVDQVPAGQPVVDDAAAGTPQGTGGETWSLAERRHARQGYRFQDVAIGATAAASPFG